MMRPTGICALMLPLMMAGCLMPRLPDQAAERENVVVASLQPGHVMIEGPLGPVVLPRACLDPVEPSVAALSPRDPAGCALGQHFDSQLWDRNDRLVPRRAGPPLSQPLADAANAYLGIGQSSGSGVVLDSPADLSGGIEGGITGGFEAE